MKKNQCEQQTSGNLGEKNGVAKSNLAEEEGVTVRKGPLINTMDCKLHWEGIETKNHRLSDDSSNCH